LITNVPTTKLEEDESGTAWTYSTQGRNENVYKILVRKPQRKILLEEMYIYIDKNKLLKFY
jgi:hypothetical protein